MRSYRYLAAASAIAVFLGAPSALWAQTAPDLGAAAPFVVLGANPLPIPGTVTCTDAPPVGPGIGIGPGSVGTTFAGGITNAPPCTIVGPIVAPVGGGVTGAFTNALGQIDIQNPVCTGVIPLASAVLAPGVYCSDAGTTLGAGVIITLLGNASDVWIFRVGTLGPGALTLTGARVNLAGGALACNVYWKTSAATTLTAVPSFVGTVLSGAGITATGTTWVGRAMARTDVTMTEPSMTFAGCAPGGQPPGCPALSLLPAVLPNGSVGVAYPQTSFSLAGGAVGAQVFSVLPGTLPPGLTLSSGGVLSGTPTTARPDTFTIRGADANGCFALRTYTVVITDGAPPPAGCPVITLSPTTLPDAAVGVAYSQQITAVGALTAVTFTRTAGDLLPAGLTLSSSGLISGTPTSPLSMTFTIRGTDANGCFSELSYQIVGLAGVPTLPQGFVIVIFLGLLLIGYAQLRNRARV